MSLIKILFVCHGNICRSPMAEFCMKRIVADNGLSDKFEIASAATSREEIGNPVYPPVRKLLSQYGISCKGKTARQITKADYDYYDYIICMEKYNLRNLKYIISEDKDNKISLLLDFTDDPHDVDDPWYLGEYEKAWKDINIGCKALFNKLLQQI